MRHRDENKKSCTSSDSKHHNFYIREELLSFQAEFPDAVISYDPNKLASRLQNRPGVPINARKNGNFWFVPRLNECFASYLPTFLNHTSPVLIAYSQYRSAGYPWSVSYLPPSSIAILAVRWLEVSPPTATVDGISDLINLESDNAAIDSTLLDSGSSTPLSSSEELSDLVEWRRWRLTYVDPYPQWRVLAFHSNQFAGIGYSNGAMEIINLNDTDNSRIFVQQPLKSDFAPMAGMNFMQDPSYLAVCRFSGEIELWHLNDKSVGFPARLVCQINHRTIFCSVMDVRNNLLVVGGEYVGAPEHHLTVLSIDNLLSFSKFDPNQFSATGDNRTSSKLRSLVLSISARKKANLSDGFASLSLSPDCNFLSALHCSRVISVWSFPACSLLTTIISDAVAIDSPAVVCRPLSPLLNSMLPVPLHLNWWKRNSCDYLLAILKSDGSLSVIDIETMENQLFSTDHQDGENLHFVPFSSFAIANVRDSTKTELFIFNCSVESLPGDDKKIKPRSNSRTSYISAFAALLGIIDDSASVNNTPDSLEESASTTAKATVIRIASTSRYELFIHRLRSCQFSEALALASDDYAEADNVRLDPESVWQYQMVALFHFPLEPTTFEKIVSVCIKKITKRVNWVLRECLREIPCVNETWRPVDFFHAVKFLLTAGLSRASNATVTAMFQERLYHLDVLTAIYAEECALSLSRSNGGDYAPNEVKRWCLEVKAYRQNSVLDIALWYLQTRRYESFSILVSHYYNLLNPHLISLLTTIPVTESPTKYLRPIKSLLFEPTEKHPPIGGLCKSFYKDAVRRLCSLLPNGFQWNNAVPDAMNLAHWACARAYEVDQLSGLTTEAGDLLGIFIEIIKNSDSKGTKLCRSKRRALKFLQRHSDEVNKFATILYHAVPGYGFSNTLRRNIDLNGKLVSLNRLKLVEFHQLTEEQHLEILICVCIAAPSKITAAEVCSVLTRRLLPFLLSYPKSIAASLLKRCLLRVADYAASGLEAISMLVNGWHDSDAEIVSFFNDTLNSCVVDFLTEFTPSPSADPETYLNHAKSILSSLHCEKEEKGSNSYRLFECCEALLGYHTLVRDLGYVVTPRGIPTSLGEALSISTGDEIRLKQLVNRWIRTTLVAQEEGMRKKSQSEEASRGVASSSLQAVKRLYFYNRLSLTPENASILPSELDNGDNNVLTNIFQCLCTTLTRLLGVDSNDKARYSLLVGVLCSGDRRFIDFARSTLVDDPENDSTWCSALQYAAGIYFDATPAFGVGEVNEELGALCLSFLPSSKNLPVSSFYGAVKFLSGIDRLKNRSPSPLSRSTWLKMSPDRKAELFTMAIQDLLDIAYMNEVKLVQAGKYFDFTETEVNRCFLKAAFQFVLKKPLSDVAIERTVALLYKILSTPEPLAWRELRMWSNAPTEALASLFPGVDPAIVERFRLTLIRFVITHSIRECSCSDFADICGEFARICASQKVVTTATENHSSVAQRIFSVLSSSSYESVCDNKRYYPCPFYLSPLDPAGLEDSFSPSISHSSLMSAFLSSWSSQMPSTETIQDTWMKGYLNPESLDVGLSYAYGPPLGQRPRNWTKLLCNSLSEAIELSQTKSHELEEYRLLAASIAASPQMAVDSVKPFHSTHTLLETLALLSAKHPRIAAWCSKALVSRLVNNPEKFFTDAVYRRGELLAISQTHPALSLLLAKHMDESRSQLVLTNLSEIIFCGDGTDPDVIKRRLKEISPYLKRDVSFDDLSSYIRETVDPRIEEIPLWRLLLLLKVFVAVAGGDDAKLSIRGVSIKKHIDFLRTVIRLDSSVYFNFVSALSKPTEEEFLISVQSSLTSKFEVDSLISLVHQCVSCPLSKIANIYAAYASRLLAKSELPIHELIDCFNAMITPDGNAAVLADWISKCLFGAEGLARSIDLSRGLALVESAASVASKKSTDSASIEKLKRFQTDLQRRIDWTNQCKDLSFLSESLRQRLLWHHFEDIETAPVLLLQAVHERLSSPRSEPLETFSALLHTFIVFTEGIARLLYMDFAEVMLTALCESINEFLSVTLADWIYLDCSSEHDLKNSDQAIVSFVKNLSIKQQASAISLLLSWSSPRQLFGRVLLEIDPSSSNYVCIAQSALDHVLVQYDLPRHSLEGVISKLVAYFQGHEAAGDLIGRILGEEGVMNASLIQAIAVAIELATLCLTENTELVFINEKNLWKSWLECFSRHSLLPKFWRQLVSRVHLARIPGEAYLNAIGTFSTENANLKAVVHSCKLLSPSLSSTTTLVDIPSDVKLDPIACRRFLSRADAWRSSEFPPSMLEAILEVAENPYYDSFLHHIFRLMHCSGDAWIETILISRIVLSRKRPMCTMEEVLKATHDLLSHPSS